MARSKPYPPSVDPGFPTLPDLPNGWRSTTFGDLLDVVERPVKLEPDKLYKLVNAKRSRGGVVLRGEPLGREILTKTQFEARTGDFLISRRQIIHGACGVVPPALDGAVVSNEYSTLREKAGVLLMEYIRQFSHTSYFQRTCFHSSHGVDVEKMIFKLNDWLKREVHVPPLPEQRKIAAILSSVDEAIEATQAVIDQLQLVKKAMMAELLTRGLPRRHTRFKQTEIGEIPEEWEVARVGDLLTDSSYGTSAKCSADANGLPVLRIPNVVNLKVTTDDLKYTEMSAQESEGYRLFEGDILVVRTNGNPLYVGRTAVFPRMDGIWLFASYLIRLRVRGSMVVPDYLHEAMQAEHVRKTMQGAIRTSAGNYNLNTSGIANTLVPVPPIDEQTHLVSVARTFDQRIAVERASLEAMKAVGASLSSALLTGELRVTPDEPTP